MLTAPTLAELKASEYLGTEHSFTDADISRALAAEIAAQKRACQFPPTALIELPVSDPDFQPGADWVLSAGATVVPWYGWSRLTTSASGGNGAGRFGSFAEDPPASILRDTTYYGPLAFGLTFSFTYMRMSEAMLRTGDRVESPWFNLDAPVGQETRFSFPGEAYLNDNLLSFGRVVQNTAVEYVFKDLTVTSGISEYPADLKEALFRRVARNLAMKALPLGYQNYNTEFGTVSTRVGADPEVRRLEAPHRRMVVG